MKNLSIRFILAVLVAGFTYTVFMSNHAEVNSINESRAKDCFSRLLALGLEGDSSSLLMQKEQVRKLNYAKFRRSLLRHRSIYYAQD